MAYSNYYAASGLFHGSMSSVMGTQFDILMVGSDPRLLGTVWEKVESEVQRLDKMLNRFDPESEVSFVNRRALPGDGGGRALEYIVELQALQ